MTGVQTCALPILSTFYRNINGDFSTILNYNDCFDDNTNNSFLEYGFDVRESGVAAGTEVLINNKEVIQ